MATVALAASARVYEARPISPEGTFYGGKSFAKILLALLLLLPSSMRILFEDNTWRESHANNIENVHKIRAGVPACFWPPGDGFGARARAWRRRFERRPTCGDGRRPGNWKIF